MSDSQGPIHINLKEVLQQKLGKKSRFVPGVLRRALERLICQDSLNELLENNYPARGSEFCRGVLRDLDVSVDMRCPANLPPREQKRVLFVCNHPLGGLDGMALIASLSEHYGCELQVVVNDLLMAVEPLAGCFVPVNTHGAQSRGTARSMENAMKGDGPVLMFPAGLVSRLRDNGEVSDLRWNRMFIRKAIEHRRHIVPLHFDGHNTPGFYRAARRRVRMGFRFNFEMILLPREVFAARGSHFTITCGRPIAWQDLAGATDAEAERIKQIVYNLPSQNQ